MVNVIDMPENTPSWEQTNGKHSTPARDLPDQVASEEDAVRVVRALVESSRIKEARLRTDEFLRIWPDSRFLQTGRLILAPAVAKVSPSTGPRRSREKENRWLQDNARNYPGEWLLVFEDRLVASGPDLDEVIRKGQETPEGREGVLWFQPTPEWNYGRIF